MITWDQNNVDELATIAKWWEKQEGHEIKRTYIRGVQFDPTTGKETELPQTLKENIILENPKIENSILFYNQKQIPFKKLEFNENRQSLKVFCSDNGYRYIFSR